MSELITSKSPLQKKSHLRSDETSHPSFGGCLLIPASSPWRHIWDNADDASFLELTGVSRHSFNRRQLVLFPDSIAQVFGLPRLLDYEHLCLMSESTGKILGPNTRQTIVQRHNMYNDKVVNGVMLYKAHFQD